MSIIQKTIQTLQENGIIIPTDETKFASYLSNTKWDTFNFRWTEPERAHEQALDSLKIIMWCYTHSALEQTISNNPTELLNNKTVEAVSQLVERLVREASQGDNQQRKYNHLASIIPDKNVVQESKHYNLLIHQIRKFDRIVRSMMPHDPVADKIQNQTDTLLHDLKLQANQEVHQLREQSREVNQITAFSNQNDKANILEQMMGQDDVEDGNNNDVDDENNEEQTNVYGNFSIDSTETTKTYRFESLIQEKEPEVKARKFSREREATPEFTELRLPKEATQKPLKDLPVTRAFISEYGEKLITLFREKNLELPTHGATRTTARNDVGSVLNKLHKKIVDNNPDRKLEALEPEKPLYLDLVCEQVAYGLGKTCTKFNIPYEDFIEEWENLRVYEAANPISNPTTYEDAVWKVLKNLEDQGKLPATEQPRSRAQVVSYFVSNGGGCVERSEAVNIKKENTRQLLDNVVAKLHTGTEINLIADQMINLLKGENVPTGSSRSVRRELDAEIERMINNPELREKSGVSPDNLKIAADNLRKLGSLHLHGANAPISWNDLKKSMVITLQAMKEIPKGSGSKELGTNYVIGSKIPLFPPGETLTKAIDFLRKAEPAFADLKNKEIGEIHRTTRSLTDSLDDPGYYAQKAANLSKADIQRQIDKADAGIELLHKLKSPDIKSRMARAIQEIAQHPSEGTEKLFLGIASIIGFSQSREVKRLYGLPRHIEQKICNIVKNPTPQTRSVAAELALHITNRICESAKAPNPDHRPFRLEETLKGMKVRLEATYQIEPKIARDAITRAGATKAKLEEQIPNLVLDLVENTIKQMGDNNKTKLKEKIKETTATKNI